MTGAYTARAAAHAARRDAELRQSGRISRWRLAVFLPALVLLLVALSRSGRPWMFAASAVLFVVFGTLVVWHARVEERAAWFDALRTVNLRAVARIGRHWADLPAAEPPANVDVTHHPYALDLDLFGRASLFQWLGPAATPYGCAALASWLLTPAEPAEVIHRQAAAAELSAMVEWREHLAAHGVRSSGARDVDVDRFIAWTEGIGPPNPDGTSVRGARLFSPALVPAVYLIVAAIWILLGLHLAGITDGAFWAVPLIIGMALSFAMTKTIHFAFERAGAGQQALSRYGALFEHATSPRFAAPWLAAVQHRLSAEGAAAPACMRRLARILSFAELRTGAALLHFPIQAFTLWDFHLLFALARWRDHTGPHIRDWFEGLGDLDALAALAGARHDNPGWCDPQIGAEPVFVARQLGHPLLPDDRRIANDVTLGPPGTLLLVTGSNMSGKSTMLRAIGLNTVLAQAGACTCASALSLPACDLQTSIRVQDSLELGLSYFMAALARLKGVVDAAEQHRQGRVLLYLLDEILQGTNSAERAIAVQGVARHLLAAGAIGAMTTHDLNLAGDEPLKSAAHLVHFTEIVDEAGQMRFDYRLREGIATSRNALRLMKMIGIEL